MKCIIIKHTHIFSFYIFSSVVFLLLVSFIQVMIPEQSFCIHHFCLMLEHKHFPTFLQILCICFEIADQQSFIGRNHNSTASSTRGHLEVWCACLFCFFADIDTTAAAISVIVCLFSFCYLHFFQALFPAVKGSDPRTSSQLLFIIFISLSHGCCRPHHKWTPASSCFRWCSHFDFLIHSKASV